MIADNKLESEKVIEGLSGWLFLGNDSNNSVGQFTGEVNLSDSKLSIFRNYLDLVISKVRCPIVFSIAPNKEYVFPEKYPFERKEPISVDGLVHERVIEIISDAGLSLDYPDKFLSELEYSYYKTDTHWSDYGAYSVLKRFFNQKLGVDICKLDLKDFSFESVSGDLGSKLDGRKDNRLSYSFNIDRFVVFDSGLKNHGFSVHYINPNSSDSRKVLIFGDSFGISYIKPLVMTFREVVFIYSPATFIEDVYSSFNPDFVILQINQRFLLDPPNIRESLSKSSVLKKFLRMSPQEIFSHYDSYVRLESNSFLRKSYIEGLISLSEKNLVPHFQKRHLIYSSENLEVITNFSVGVTDKIVISFTSRSDTPQRSGFGEVFFEKIGVSSIFFISKANHWWQLPEMESVLNIVEPLLSSSKYIITYGASMGAHGALVFSKRLRANCIIAASPQYAINGRLVPWTSRWSIDTKDVSEIFPIETGLSLTAKTVCIYDPFNSFDVVHVNAISKLVPLERVPTSFSGHSTLIYLKDIGVLSRFMKSVIEQKLDTKLFNKELTLLKRDSLKYLFGISVLSSKYSSRSRLLAWAKNRILLIVDKFLSGEKISVSHLELSVFLKLHCKDLVKTGKAFEAVQLAKRYVELYPDITFSHDVLSSVYWKLKNYDLALLESKRALRLQRKNSSLRLSVARLQIANKLYEDALNNINSSFLYHSKDKKAWVALYKDIKDINYFSVVLADVYSKIIVLDPDFKDF
ncbi:hypothetical protein P0F28_003026 [Vibrio metschnikovii]|nr:hypothetical protein [Vibrio metschnikovii]